MDGFSPGISWYMNFVCFKGLSYLRKRMFKTSMKESWSHCFFVANDFLHHIFVFATNLLTQKMPCQDQEKSLDLTVIRGFISPDVSVYTDCKKLIKLALWFCLWFGGNELALLPEQSLLEEEPDRTRERGENRPHTQIWSLSRWIMQTITSKHKRAQVFTKAKNVKICCTCDSIHGVLKIVDW